MKKLLIGSAIAALAFASQADAAIVIGYSINGGAIQTATTSNSGSANFNDTRDGYFFNVSGTGSPLLAMPNLLTQSVNIQQSTAGAGTLSVYVSQTDLTAYTGGLQSVFTSNTLQGVTAVISSYIDTQNRAFNGAVLASSPFTSPGQTSSTSAVSTSGLFSETVRYDLTFGAVNSNNPNNFNGTGNIAAVPEPATWAMMLLGFAMVGGVARYRRRNTAVVYS